MAAKHSITRRAFMHAASAVTTTVGLGVAPAVLAKESATLESLAAEYRDAKKAWDDLHEVNDPRFGREAKAYRITKDKSHPVWSAYYDAEDRRMKAERALLDFCANNI